MSEIQFEEFLKDLYKAGCRQSECYGKYLIVSLTANVIMLLVIIIKWICI